MRVHNRRFLLLSLFLAASNAFAADPGPSAPYAAPEPEFRKALQPLPKITPLPVLVPVNREEVVLGSVLESLEDVPAVAVLGADGQIRKAVAGSLLEVGDSFQTGEKGTARVLFESGAQLLVGSNTIVRLEEEKGEGGGPGPEQIPSIRVEKGEVRALVEAKPIVEGQVENNLPGSHPLKFIIRTKAAVMGVRGTDFIVEASDEHTFLHTVNGTVEIAKEPQQIRQGRGTPVPPTYAAEAFTGPRQIQEPEHFEVAAYLKEFHERHPKLEPLWQSAVNDVKTHATKRRFDSIRKLKADQVNMSRGFTPEQLQREQVARDLEKKKLLQRRKDGEVQAEGLDQKRKGKRHKGRRQKRR